MDTHILAFVGTLEKKQIFEEAVRRMDDTVLTVQEAVVADAAQRMANGNRADVIFVDIDSNDEHAVKRIESIISGNPNAAVIATSPEASLEAIRQFMRLGVVDFLPQPLKADEVVSTILSARQRTQESVAPKPSGGRVVSLLKMTGGAGSSTLAVQMAHAAAGRRPGLFRKRKGVLSLKTSILDLDIQGGSVATYLDLSPRYSVMDIVSSNERLDAALLETCLTSHDSGLRVLAAPTELLPLDAIEPDDVRQVVKLTRQFNDLVVVDLPHTWTPWTTAALKSSDLVVCVLQMTVASVRQTRRRLDALQQIGIEDIPVCLVANRHSKAQLLGSKRRIKEAEKALGRRIDYFIGSDFKRVSESLDIGKPLAEIHGGARIAKTFSSFLDLALDRARQSTNNEPRLIAGSSSIAA